MKATKVRIYPKEQAEFLIGQFGAVRFAYNQALRIKRHRYKMHGENLNVRMDIKPLLSVAKKSRRYDWLRKYDSSALQQSVLNLEKAFKNFFNKKLTAKYPRFKNKHKHNKSYHCTSIHVFDNAIKIPKIKTPIKAKIHREISGKLLSITLSMLSTGQFYVSILTHDVEEKKELPKSIDKNKAIGIDLGLSHFAIQSNSKKHLIQDF